MSQRHPTIERRAAMRAEEMRHAISKAERHGLAITLEEHLREHEESFRQGVTAALIAVSVDLAQIRVGEEAVPHSPGLLRFPDPQKISRFPLAATEARFHAWPTSHPVFPPKS